MYSVFEDVNGPVLWIMRSDLPGNKLVSPCRHSLQGDKCQTEMSETQFYHYIPLICTPQRHIHGY